MSDLGKFEKSDLTPEMVTAKNEYVTVFHTSEAGSSQSTAQEESAGPGQVQVVLLGHQRGRVRGKLHVSPRADAGKEPPSLQLGFVL